MERKELAEWIAIIVIMIAWWPRIFFGYDPLWYHVLIVYVSPIVLVAILIVRYRRVREGFEYSERVIKAQHKAAGRDVIGAPKQREESGLPWLAPPSAPPEEPREGEKRN